MFEDSIEEVNKMLTDLFQYQKFVSMTVWLVF